MSHIIGYTLEHFRTDWSKQDFFSLLFPVGDADPVHLTITLRIL